MSRLLQLNVTANWGSTGKIAEGIGEAAMARGWESAIAYGRYSNESKSELIKVGTQGDVYLHYARHRFFDGEGLGSKRPTKQLIEQIKEYNPDIIHLHNIHDHWLNYPTLFEYLACVDTPVVWTFHDCWAFTGGCAYFDKIDCNKWKTECDKCPLSFRHSLQNYNLRQRYFLPLGDRLNIVPVSSWLEGFVKESIFKDCNIRMIHNGIDLNKFSYRWTKKKVVLGVALPWSERKGLRDMIQLRDLLPKEIEIRLIGVSKKQIKDLPLGIIGIERTQSIEELVKNYSEAMVFVNPTYEDNFPTVNLEALACGTPVVTYRTGGSPEAVDECTGIVVEKGDKAGLAKSIMEVIDNPDRFSRESCRSRAEMEFDKDIQFGKYIDLYESLIRQA